MLIPQASFETKDDTFCVQAEKDKRFGINYVSSTRNPEKNETFKKIRNNKVSLEGKGRGGGARMAPLAETCV